MSATEIDTPSPEPRPTSEAERLREELAAVKQRLQEEVAYHRARAETARQQAEAQHLRQQAAEVARRRRLEDHVATLDAQLREVRDHSDRLQRRYDELSNQFLRQEESTRHSVEEEVARYKAAARSAWQSAEEELAKMEKEMQRVRQELDQERARSRQLEDTLRNLQGLEGGGGEDQAAALSEELTALKKALNLSERRRAQLQMRTVRLAEQLVEMQASVAEAEEVSPATPSGQGSEAHVRNVYRAFHTGAGNPTEVDLSEANAVLRQAAQQHSGGRAADGGTAGGLIESPEEELAEEFMLMAADSSLDRAKLARLQQQVERQEAEDRAREAQATSQPARHKSRAKRSVPSRAQAPAEPPKPTDLPLFSPGIVGKVFHVLLVILLLLVLGGLAAWFLGGDAFR